MITTQTLGASRNLYNKFSDFRINKQISKTTKKANKPLNESLNDSGNIK